MPAPCLRIASAQMKFRRSVADNVEWIIHTIRHVAQEGVKAVLFPECAVTGYNHDFAGLPGETIRQAIVAISVAARSARCSVLVGCPTFQGRQLRNSLLVFDAGGREVFRYSKIHLTPRDARFFAPGNALALFRVGGVECTAIVCHERRYPELVRLPVMLGAQILFHPNAGLDPFAVSKAKRKCRDGIAVRAFENQVCYVFANSVGPQGDNLWSAGDSKIVGPDSNVLALANNRDEMVIQAELDLSKAGRRYAQEALLQPEFLRAHWRSMLAACRKRLSRG